ncbi:MAG: DUF4249 domain-containing protein [Flavobacteriales bacterium]|nr:DUF4249 domain-containing protein [Flavobacteriales bacterium]
MKGNFLAAIIFLFFISCEKVIPIDANFLKSKLVINSIFFKDSSCTVHISSSTSVLEKITYENIEDADLSVKDSNGNLIENLQYLSNGFYKGSEKLQADNQYYLNAVHKNFNNVLATTSIPKNISIHHIDTLSYLENGKERFRISVSFIDDGDINNYYKLGVEMGKYVVDTLSLNGSTFIDSAIIYKWVKIYRDHEVLERTITNKEVIFNDNTFNGTTFSVNFSIKDVIRDSNINLAFLKLYFYNIDNSLYNYEKSIKQYFDNYDIPSTQPVQVFSNIENGFGVLSSANVNTVRLY